jgi:PAS domain S-box-containing protein
MDAPDPGKKAKRPADTRPDDELLRLMDSAVRQSKESILITDSELDLPGPRIVFVNPAFTAMTGYESHEVIGKTPRILQGPHTDRDVLSRQRNCLEHGETFEGEAVNYRKNGEEFVLEWQVAPIRDTQGNITHFVAIQRDITERKKIEDASHRFAAIVEYSGDAIIGKDLNGIINSWNKGAEMIFGYKPEEMIGKSITLLIPEDRRDEDNKIIERIRSGRAVEHFETQRRHKDGHLIEVSVTASPIKDAEGTIVGASKSARDITWKRREEAARKSSEARYRTLFEHAPVGILIADDRGYYVDANASICTMLGYTRDELVGLHSSDIVAEDEKKFVEPAIGVIKSRAEYHREWQFRRKDGSSFWAEVMATMMPDGKLLGMVQDVTERRSSVRKIAEQAEFMDKARDAIIVRDLDGTIAFWNKGAEHIYGWTTEEAVGRKISDLIYKSPSKFEELNALTISKGEWQGELEQVSKDRSEKAIDARWTLIRDESGEPKSVLAINSDVTERKKIEAQFMRAQRMESIGTLAGGIAHDLNNILAPIMMSIEVLKLVSDDPRAVEILNTIDVSAKRGADIVRQVLSFARGLEGERVEVQPKHILNDLRNIIRDTFPKDVRLTFEIASDPWTIFGDPTQVQQILLNLCVNARDAMPHGGELKISVENIVLDEHYAAMNLQAKPGRYVNIKVTDTGTGIPQNIIGKIFEPFFTTKELTKGTGLGLSTVMAIVKSHEGIINVYSEPGRGTTFKVYLPAIGISSDVRKDLSDLAVLPRGNGETILVADDEASVLSITAQTLQAFGYTVLSASDGAEALSIYLQNRDKIALIITDIMMPIMDGPALIHALNRTNRSLKIIAASGLNANGEVAKISGTGVSHFLTKPYTARTLLKTVRDVIDDRRTNKPGTPWTTIVSG